MNPLAFLLCLRPRQWTKNLLIFAGIIFSREWGDQQLLLNVVGAFFVFCALSGVVYITNDILDVEKDREHPKKRKRPIASGAISPGAAAVGAVVLLVGGLWASWLITPTFFLCSVIYVLLVTLYSFWFKHMVVLDVMVLAMGFVVRAIAGVEALHEPGLDRVIPVTPYFILTTLFLALFLAVAKRRNELVVLKDSAAGHRKVLEDYSTEFCDVLLTVATAGVIFSYAMWATSGAFQRGGALSPVRTVAVEPVRGNYVPEDTLSALKETTATVELAGSASMEQSRRGAAAPRGSQGVGGAYTLAFTMPFVLYGIFRYLWLVFRKDEGGAPEMLLLTDKPLLITVLLWVITVIAILASAGG